MVRLFITLLYPLYHTIPKLIYYPQESDTAQGNKNYIFKLKKRKVFEFFHNSAIDHIRKGHSNNS